MKEHAIQPSSEDEMIKDIVVQLTGSEEDKVRLAYAEAIARQFDAHLTGLQVHSLPEVLTITDPTGSAFLRELIAESDKGAAAVGDRLKKLIDSYGMSSELRRLDLLPGQIGDALAREARTADLFVGTRPYGDPTRQQHIEETVLFRSGRGCLFVPPKGKPPQQYATIFVAWKPTREAARAVAEALPFLQGAKQVVVGIVEEQGASEQYHDEPGADIGRYLSRHGVSAEIRMINGWDNPSAALANEAKQIGADMIVMGGYGHSRFREWALGGATRDILGSATVPVLMAH
jgi:nucleotide-binding universal stress UspA family protein